MQNNNVVIFFICILCNISIPGFPQYLHSSAKMNVNIKKSEFVFKRTSSSQCHASSIVETKNGILVTWFEGTHEGHQDVCIYTSELKDGEWTAPVLVADGIIMNDSLQYPCWNPVLFRYNDEIFLYYKIGSNPRSWWGVYKVSNDEGKSWSSVKNLRNGI